MDYFRVILNSTVISWETALLRFLISFILGTLVGLEREAHSQPAGLRTHILISIGSTMIMMISIFIPQTFTDFPNGDPGRIAAQVVSGIGFLGAGAILRFGVSVKGLTTAASIWAMAAIGMAVGAGMYAISGIGVAIVLFALSIMDLFEKRIFKERTLRRVEIAVRKKDISMKNYEQIFKKFDLRISSSGIERNQNDPTDRLTYIVGVPPNIDLQKLTDVFEAEPGVISISIMVLT